MARSLDVAKLCVNVEWYGVGSIIVDSSNNVIATGFTGELLDRDGKMRHAEDCAIDKARSSNANLSECTLYSTLEPCSIRASGKTPCVEKIHQAGLTKVVFGAREPFDPSLKVVCQGIRMLKELGVEVVQLIDLENECLSSAVSSRRKKD